MLWKLLLILLLVLIVFGAGKLPKVMRDMGKGVRGFKDEVDTKANPKVTENVVRNNAEPREPVAQILPPEKNRR